MKKIIMMSVLAGSVIITACGQKKDVPEAVSQAFDQKFPEVKNVTWDMEKEDEWEAGFEMNGKEYSANFNPNGEWMETEYEIKKKDIPTAVKSTLDRDFKGYGIEESEISETAEGKFYEFELEEDEYTLEVTLDINGKVLKKEVREEDDDD